MGPGRIGLARNRGFFPFLTLLLPYRSDDVAGYRVLLRGCDGVLGMAYFGIDLGQGGAYLRPQQGNQSRNRVPHSGTPVIQCTAQLLIRIAGDGQQVGRFGFFLEADGGAFIALRQQDICKRIQLMRLCSQLLYQHGKLTDFLRRRGTHRSVARTSRVGRGDGRLCFLNFIVS